MVAVGAGLSRDQRPQLLAVGQPGVADVCGDTMLVEGLSQNGQAAFELAAHDAVRSVGGAQGAPLIGNGGAEGPSGELEFHFGQTPAVNFGEEEADHVVVADPLDEVADHRTQPRFAQSFPGCAHCRPLVAVMRSTRLPASVAIDGCQPLGVFPLRVGHGITADRNRWRQEGCMQWVRASRSVLSIAALAGAALACTQEQADRPVFPGPDEMPGFRAGGVQDFAGYERAIRKRVPAPAEFDLGGWMNAQVTALPDAASSADLSLHAMAAVERTPQAAGVTAILQIGIGSSRLLPTWYDAGAAGDHIGLVLAVDESASMGDGARLRSLREGLRALIDSLPEGVHLGVVGFGGTAHVLWPARPWDPDTQRADAYTTIGKVQAAGGTNTHAGLARALAMAEAMPADLQHRHVILITDGRPSRGLVQPEDFTGLLAGRATPTGLSVLGVGENLDVTLLRKIAALGGGNTWLIGNPSGLAWAILDAYRSIGSPTIRELQLEVTLADGWTVVDAPGLHTESLSGGAGLTLRIRQPRQRLRATSLTQDEASAVVCEPEPVAKAAAANATAASSVSPPFPSRLAVGHPGVVMLRIGTLDEPAAADLEGLEMARVTARYLPEATIAGDTPPVTLTQVVRMNKASGATADSFVLTSSPVARRTLALLRAGQALQRALLIWRISVETDACGAALTVGDGLPEGSAAELRKAAINGLLVARAGLAQHQDALGLGSPGLCADLADPNAYERCVEELDPGEGLSLAAQHLEALGNLMVDVQAEASNGG